MTKTFFTESEIKTLFEILGTKLHVSFNKCGNVKVENPNETPKSTWYGKSYKGYWVLYKYDDGKFLWRHHDGGWYSYPLNMRGRKFEGNVTRYRNEETGKLEYWGYKPYNTDMSKFNNLADAMDYFVKYLKKYRHITL